jgi:hypothetical protein
MLPDSIYIYPPGQNKRNILFSRLLFFSFIVWSHICTIDTSLITQLILKVSALSKNNICIRNQRQILSTMKSFSPLLSMCKGISGSSKNFYHQILLNHASRPAEFPADSEYHIYFRFITHFS